MQKPCLDGFGLLSFLPSLGFVRLIKTYFKKPVVRLFISCSVAGSFNNGLKFSALKIDMTAVPAAASIYPDAAVSSKASGAIKETLKSARAELLGGKNAPPQNRIGNL